MLKRVFRALAYPAFSMFCGAGGCGLWFALLEWFTYSGSFPFGGRDFGALIGGLFGLAFGGVFGLLLGLAALIVRSRPQLIVVAGLVVGLLAAAVAMNRGYSSAPLVVAGAGLVLLYTLIDVVMAAWVTRTGSHRG